MNGFLNKMERKFGNKGIPHLTTIMIGLIVVGYLFQAFNPRVLTYLTLNPERILHLQIWRIVTWVIIPPTQFDIFTVIMLFFYWSIGTSLERALGDFRYNVYIFGGMLITFVAALITYAIYCALYPVPEVVGAAIGSFFSTYYICMSILLAYAATFPDAVVLVMFVIPVKMKYFGFIYGAFMIYDAVTYIRAAVNMGPLYVIPVIAMVASVVNFGIFFYLSRHRVHLTAEQKKRQKEFRRQVLEAGGRMPSQRESSGGTVEKVTHVGARHHCEVCGRTEISDPDLEFRYCSKCNGAHEYCMEHLYTHVHIKAGNEKLQENQDNQGQGDKV